MNISQRISETVLGNVLNKCNSYGLALQWSLAADLYEVAVGKPCPHKMAELEYNEEEFILDHNVRFVDKTDNREFVGNILFDLRCNKIFNTPKFLGLDAGFVDILRTQNVEELATYGCRGSRADLTGKSLFFDSFFRGPSLNDFIIDDETGNKMTLKNMANELLKAIRKMKKDKTMVSASQRYDKVVDLFIENTGFNIMSNSFTLLNK